MGNVSNTGGKEQILHIKICLSPNMSDKEQCVVQNGKNDDFFEDTVGVSVGLKNKLCVASSRVKQTITVSQFLFFLKIGV